MNLSLLLFHHPSNISSFLWRYQTCATLKVEVKFDATITLVEHRKNSFGAILHKATQIQLSENSVSRTIYYRGQPKAGTGYKTLYVPFVFSMSRFHSNFGQMHRWLSNSAFKVILIILRLKFLKTLALCAIGTSLPELQFFSQKNICDKKRLSYRTTNLVM